MSDLTIIPGSKQKEPPKPPPIPDIKPNVPPVPDIPVPPPPPLPAPDVPAPDLEKVIDTMPNPEEASAKVDNSLKLSNILDMDPAVAHKMHDSIVEKYAGKKESPTTFKERIKGYWKGAVTTQQLGELYSQIIFKGDSEELRKRISELESQMPESKEIIEGLPQKMKRRFKEYYFGEAPYWKRVKALAGETAEESIKLIVEQVPRWMQAAKEGSALGLILTGTAIGITAAVGLLIPAPEEAATIPAAASLGLGVGMKIGAFKSLARVSSGLTLRNLENFEDSKGNKMDPTIAKYIALSIGTLEGLSEMVEMSLLFKTLPGKKAAVEATKQAVVNTMMSNKFKKVVSKGLKKYAIFNVQELGQELFQETVHIIGEELGKELNNKFKKTDIKKSDIKQIVERYKETALASMLMFPVLGLPGTVATTVQSIAQISKEKGISLEEAGKVQKEQIKDFDKEVSDEGLEVPKEKDEWKVYSGKYKEIVNEAELETGQKFTIGGKNFKVIEKNEEGTIIKTGQSEIILKDFEELEIDRNTLSERIVPAKKDTIYAVARRLWKDERQQYEEYAKTDILSQIEDAGKINVRYFAESEEVADIPAHIRKRIFTSDPAAPDLDEVASSLGMTDTELIQKLQTYEPIEKPIPLKEFVRILIEEQGTPLERFLLESEKDDKLVTKTRSTLRKAYSLGKKEAALKAKEKYHEAVVKKAVRTETREHIKEIVDNLRSIESKVKKMYPEFAQPIRNLLDGIELVKHNKPFLLELYNIRKYFEDNPEAEISDRVKERLDILDKRDLNNITVQELEDIHIAVSHYAHLNKVAQEIRIGKEQMKKDMAIAKAISEMKSPKMVKDTIITSQRGKLAQAKDIGILIKDTLGIRHNHYDLIIESLAGPNSAMDKILYQGVKEGITEQLKYRQDVFKKFQTRLEESGFKVKNIDKWLNEKVKVGDFKFTRNERMSLYRHSLNEDNYSTIIDGGFGLRKGLSKIKSYSMSEEQLNEILRSLTKDERLFAGEVVDKLFEEQYEAMNKVFIEKNGYVWPKEENYYPKDVMPSARRTDIDLETQTALELYKGKWLRIGLSKGMLKERMRVQVPLYLNGLTYDINKSVLGAASYVGLEIPLNNASKLLYNREFKNELVERYSERTWKEIEQGLRDIAGEFKSYTTVETISLWLKNRLTTSILGLNPWIMIKQPLSYAVYAPYVKPMYLMKGIVDYITQPKEIRKRHEMFSPELLERLEQGYSRDVADVLKLGSEKRLFAGHKNIREIMVSPIRFFDKITVIPGMWGAVLQVLDEFKEGKLSREVKIALDIKDSEIVDLQPIDKMKLAYKYADYATERTQPSFAAEHQSSLQRGGVIEKHLTMFGSFTNQALNLIRRTWMDVKETKDPGSYKKLAWVIFTLGVVNPMGVIGVNRLRDYIYGRDKEDNLLLDWINSIAGYFFYIRDFTSSLISKIRRGTWLGYDITIPILRIPNLLVNAVANGIDALTEQTKSKREKAAFKCIDDSLELFLMMEGLPYPTPRKTTEGIIEKID